MVERRTVDAVVAGSNPVIRPKKPWLDAGALDFNGFLESVQSCPNPPDDVYISSGLTTSWYFNLYV